MRNLAPRNLKIALALVALAACSTDVPTAPERNPAPPPGSAPTTAWSITVTVEPRDLTANNSQPATITIQVRRASDNTPPQDGTLAVVRVGLGDLDSSGSGLKEAAYELSGGGIATLLYFAGTILGTDVIEAQLEESVGSTRVNIVEDSVVFIESVAPNSGPQGGGTRIRVSGSGFSEPLRVTVGSINASVDAVGEDAQGGFIRAFTGPAPDSFFSTEGCDTDGDGSLDGQRYIPTTADVKVELFPDGGDDTLTNAFTYRPGDTSCRDATPGPDPPNADFTFLVQGLTVQFFNETTPQGASTTYTWDFGDLSGFNTAEDPTHTYAAPGDYDVTLRAENASGSSIRTRTVTVP